MNYPAAVVCIVLGCLAFQLGREALRARVAAREAYLTKLNDWIRLGIDQMVVASRYRTNSMIEAAKVIDEAVKSYCDARFSRVSKPGEIVIVPSDLDQRAEMETGGAWAREGFRARMMEMYSELGTWDLVRQALNEAGEMKVA